MPVPSPSIIILLKNCKRRPQGPRLKQTLHLLITFSIPIFLFPLIPPSSPMDPHSSSPPPPSWSRLPRDLLLNIANRLHSRIGRLCVRAVCNSWRSAVPPPPRRSTPPLKLPPPAAVCPNADLNPRLRGHFDFVECTVYCLQPLKKISDSWKTSKCWLIEIEEAEDLPGTVRFKDPLYGFDHHCHNLSPHLPKRLNLLDYRVSEIAKSYELRYEPVRKLDIFEMCSEIPPSDFKPFMVTRVAACSEGSDFAVMAIHSAGELAIWRMVDKAWTSVNDGRDRAFYIDVVYHNGKFYAVDTSGVTISVEFSLKTTRVAPALPSCGHIAEGVGQKRLLSSVGDLFLLNKVGYRLDAFLERFGLEGVIKTGALPLPAYFNVYKLDVENLQWVRVKSLGNRAVIIGDNCTYSVSAQEARGCKMNCIYFPEDCFCSSDDEDENEEDEDDDPGYDAAVFDMEDCCSYMLREVMAFSGLFWPPPSWVVPRDARVRF